MKLFALVTLFSLLAASFGQPMTMPNPDMTVTSQGTGTSEVPLTTARVTVRVESIQPSAAVAQSNVTARANDIIAMLLASGVDNQTGIRTESINVSPEYDYINGTQVLRGYRSTYVFSFDIAVERAGDLIDKVVALGGNIDSIEFLGSPEDIAEAQNEALTAATEDARRKATTVLSALGLCPDGVKSIIVGYVQAPQTTSVSDNSFKLVAAPSTPVMPGTGKVTANVNIEWMFMECASTMPGNENNMSETNTTASPSP